MGKEKSVAGHRGEVKRLLDEIRQLNKSQVAGDDAFVRWLARASKLTNKLNHSVRHFNACIQLHPDQAISTDSQLVLETAEQLTKLQARWTQVADLFRQTLEAMWVDHPDFQNRQRRLMLGLRSTVNIASFEFMAELYDFLPLLRMYQREPHKMPPPVKPWEQPKVTRPAHSRLPGQKRVKPVPVEQEIYSRPTWTPSNVAFSRYNYKSTAKCFVCRCQLIDLVCTQCWRHICPRCGGCSTGCAAKEVRRESRLFGIYKESRVPFVPDDEWQRRRKEQQEAVGRPIDFDVDPRGRS